MSEQKTLSKSEAIAEMKKGNKVTHRYFSDDEYITMENGKIKTEEGYLTTPFEFWRWRTQKAFNTDWKIFQS